MRTKRDVTHAEYSRMSWHQRQAFNANLRAETTRLEAEIARLDSPTNRARFDAQLVRDSAAQILARLPVDPDAAQHRLDLLEELTMNPPHPPPPRTDTT